MKIKWHGYLGKNHSWSLVGQNISRSLIRQGHEVHLISTNGLEDFPEDLKPYLKDHPDENYDVQLSYTSMKNFPSLLGRGSKNRFGIWCYEFKGRNSLPTGFAKHYKYCDKILAPSQFAKQVFLDSGVPDNHVTVVPHGVDRKQFQDAVPMDIGVPQKVRILTNIAQPHIRKNLRGVFDAYGKAFTSKDDVCLVLKIANKSAESRKMQFDVSFDDELKRFKSLYRDAAPIKIIRQFIPDIASLVNACNVTFSMTKAECFWMPGLEALTAHHIVLSPRYGGQLDYLSDDNSLLIEGKEVFAPPAALYWEPKSGTKYFEPSIDDAVTQLRNCYDNFDALNSKFASTRQATVDRHDWLDIATGIMNFVE